ncbi:hypothetical protein [Microbacterium sp. NPDC086615]|uniref:hypothetical protein n=1 Tax=Microbacterium sp. NPDC086615 TaxID=3154865 RepID=UPI00342E56FA
MAHMKDYRLAYQTDWDPAQRFIDWLVQDDGKGIADTVIGRELREGKQPTCILDYMLGWLVESNAALFCPTYEAWLFTVISIADQLRRDRFGRDYADENGDWTQDEIKNYTKGLVDLSIPLLDDELELSHPALNRNTYELARDAAIRWRK